MPQRVLEGGGLKVTIAPHEGAAEALVAARSRLLEAEPLRTELNNSEHRVVSFRAEEDDDGGPVRFRSVIYDYSNSRTLTVEGAVDDVDGARVTQSAHQPLPTEEEFDAAVDILTNDPEIAKMVKSEGLVAYRPLPPVVARELPDGRSERVVVVGLYSEDDNRHRFLGVNMSNKSITPEVAEAPAQRAAECGAPSSPRCPPTGSGGAVSVRVDQGSTTLWSFTVRRPAASSGTNGSGVELRSVSYRGARVLRRAHVPILNVQYFRDGAGGRCGPTYRDWQNEEACFQADGADVMRGYRVCSSPAKTLLDTGIDRGNFRGVAFYLQGRQLVLVSEMQAGWYRYISEWRLHADGRIQPRFGFGATRNPCTCAVHHHHAYWRFDFGIRGGANDLVREYNDPPLQGGAKWHRIRYETRRARNRSRKRYWRVENMPSGGGYDVVPGTNDGAADDYGVGDVWVLRHRAGQIDDGQGFSTDPRESRAHLNIFINHEAVTDTDVVFWYAGHFKHEPHGSEDHWVGPTLRPFNWE